MTAMNVRATLPALLAPLGVALGALASFALAQRTGHWGLTFAPVALGLVTVALLLRGWAMQPPSPLLVGALAFTVLASVSARRATYRPEGDEPWYLVQADSLAHDGDLVTPMEEITARSRWHYGVPLQFGDQLAEFDGRLRVVHWPATALFLVPACLVHSRLLGELTLALLVALAAARGARLLGGLAENVHVGAAIMLLIVVASPLGEYGLLFFPDGIAACVWLLAAERLLGGRVARTLAGLLLALLVALRPSLVLLVPGAFLAARRRVDRFVLAGLGAGLAIFALSEWQIFGGVGGPHMELALGRVPRAIGAALFEPGRGLLLNYPLWGLVALAVVGAARRIREGRRAVLLVAVAALAMGPPVLFVTSAGVGGWCPAARFWTPMLMPIAAALALAWPALAASKRGRPWRGLALVLVLVSITTALAGDLEPFWSFNDGTHWIQRARAVGLR